MATSVSDNGISQYISKVGTTLTVIDGAGNQVQRIGNIPWRNNNPGDIRDGSFARSQPGYIGSDGAFAIFATPDAGYAAQSALLFGKSYINLSIADAITKYAPPSENNTTAYINSITTALGVSSNTPLSSLSADQRIALVHAMSKVEGYKVGTILLVGGGQPNTAATPPTPPTEPPTSAGNPDYIPINSNTGIFTFPVPNPLLAYASWTYSISLHLLTPDEYNTTIQQGKFVANRVLIASAGRYNNTLGTNQFIRSPYFNEDFYFENLSMTTIVGLNSNSRATNAIDLKFDIMEPYGITLVDRILFQCKDLNIDNYLACPYLLEVDFYGIDDTGNIVGQIPNTSKYIPIQLTGMTVKASHKGAEYNIQAVPYNHSAYDVSTVQTPARFEVTAGTVNSFFQSTETSDPVINFTSQRQPAPTTTASKPNTTYGSNRFASMPVSGSASPSTTGATAAPKLNGPGYAGSNTLNAGTTNPTSAQNAQSSPAPASADRIYKVKSYGSALNAYQNDQVRNNQLTFPDKYQFKFYGEIDGTGFKSILGQGKQSSKDTPMGDPNEISSRRANTNAKADDLQYGLRIFSINAGTSVEQIINYVLRNSDYIQNQLVVPQDYKTKEDFLAAKQKYSNLPFNWFKIVPTIELKDYDPKTKHYSRVITYHVMPYPIYNTKIDVTPQGQASNPLKDYHYYYTGLNDEILDLNIEFNALYYTAITNYRGNMADINDVTESDSSVATGDSGLPDQPNAVQPVGQRPVPPNTKIKATGGEISQKQAATVDTQASLYTSAQGDMISLKLKIIGDPSFIKQDDLFFSPQYTLVNATTFDPTVDPRLTSNGSIKTDAGEVYVNITFKSPSDLDEMTGLVKYDPKYKESKFSGLYRVLTVESNFSGGHFTQTLDIVRLPRQSINMAGKADPNNPQRESTQPPGEAAISQNYDIGPNFNSPSPTAADSTAPGSTPLLDTGSSVYNAQQAQLSQVAQSAPSYSLSAYTDVTNSIGGTLAVNQVGPAPDYAPISVAGNQVPGAAAITG